MDHVEIRDGHWIWTGSTGSSGYGKIKSGGRRGKDLSVTHVVWEHHRGPVPPGHDLDHLEECLVILCCRPEHLEPVTKAENQRRRAERRKACGNGHPWTPETTRITKDGQRDCKICHAGRERARRNRNRARFTEYCSRGHLRTPENTLPAGPGWRCRDCISEGALQRWAAVRESGSG
jgi:hypothetical protein